MTKKISLFIGIFLFTWTEVYATDSIGTVIAAQGKVYAKSKTGASRSLQRRSDFYLNDLITTEENSSAQLKLNDDTIISLKPSTKYNVSEFNFNPKDPKKNSYIGNLAQGALISMSGQGKDGQHLLKTPVVTIAIRGTLYGTGIKFVCGKNIVCKNKTATALSWANVAVGSIDIGVKDGKSFTLVATEPKNAMVLSTPGSVGPQSQFTPAPSAVTTAAVVSTKELQTTLDKTTEILISTKAGSATAKNVSDKTTTSAKESTSTAGIDMGAGVVSGSSLPPIVQTTPAGTEAISAAAEVSIAMPVAPPPIESIGNHP